MAQLLDERVPTRGTVDTTLLVILRPAFFAGRRTYVICRHWGAACRLHGSFASLRMTIVSGMTMRIELCSDGAKSAIRAHCLMPDNANEVVALIRDVEIIGGIERNPRGIG